MALFKPPTDYRGMFRNLGNDELTAIINNQSGAYDAQAVETARALLNERYASQTVRSRPTPVPRVRKKQTWIWWVVGYLLFRLLMEILEKTK